MIKGRYSDAVIRGDKVQTNFDCWSLYVYTGISIDRVGGFWRQRVLYPNAVIRVRVDSGERFYV